MESLRIESVDDTKPLGYLVKQYAGNAWYCGFVTGAIFTSIVFMSIKAIKS